MHKFMIRAMGNNPQEIKVKTSIYNLAAASVPALLGLSIPCEIEIWCPDLLPNYGPYMYRIEYDEAQNVICSFMFGGKFAFTEIEGGKTNAD